MLQSTLDGFVAFSLSRYINYSVDVATEFWRQRPIVRLSGRRLVGWCVGYPTGDSLGDRRASRPFSRLGGNRISSPGKGGILGWRVRLSSRKLVSIYLSLHIAFHLLKEDVHIHICQWRCKLAYVLGHVCFFSLLPSNNKKFFSRSINESEMGRQHFGL